MELSAGITKLEIRRAVLASELLGVDRAIELLREMEASPAAPKARSRRPRDVSVRRRPTRAPRADVEKAFLAALGNGPLSPRALGTKLKMEYHQFRVLSKQLIAAGRVSAKRPTMSRRLSLLA